jgi:hypothetical protein
MAGHRKEKVKIVSTFNICSFAVSLILVVLFILFQFTNLLTTFESNYILPLNNDKQEIVITDKVPDDFSKIFLDVNQAGFNPSKYTLTSYENKPLDFYETLYGFSAQVGIEDLDENLDLHLSSYSMGDVNIIVTYANMENQKVKQFTQVEHFPENLVLIYCFRFLLLLLALIVLIPQLLSINKRRHSPTPGPNAVIPAQAGIQPIEGETNA